MDFAARAKEVIGIEAEGLVQVAERIDGDFSRTVTELAARLGRGGKLVVTGIGKNLHVGAKMAATLTSTGAPAVLLHPLEALHGDLGLLQAADALLALSYSGESPELLNLLPLAKRAGLFLVAVTGEPDSTLARLSDAVLSVRVPREACPFNLAPTASTTATLALGDALALVLLEARGFSREDYARLHPGGSIGKTLLLQVKDVMRSGAQLPRVGPETSVQDALSAMTGARAGAVVVTDEAGRPAGVFTDGDLRRLLAQTGSISGVAVREAMSPRPVCVVQDQLAAEALAVFEQHKIDDLVVVDRAGVLVGLVDIQDFPKLKLL